VPTDSTASPSPGCYRLTNERGRAPARPTPTPGLPVPATGRCPSGRRVKPRPVGDERPFRRRRNPSLDPRSASSFPALASTPSTAASMKVVSVRSRRRIDPTRVWWCRSRRRVERRWNCRTRPMAGPVTPVRQPRRRSWWGSAPLSVYAGTIGSETGADSKSWCQRVCSPDAGPRVATEASEHEPSRTPCVSPMALQPPALHRHRLARSLTSASTGSSQDPPRAGDLRVPLFASQMISGSTSTV
jgi:hypothetical protein